MATELGKAYVQIIPSASGIKGRLAGIMNPEASAAGESAGKAAGNSLGEAIKKAIVAAGIGTALKATLMEGADLQQSLGGIETLFKDSADKVIENAKNAYKTAGLSANDYMESVTSFSASLLQGLAGDTNKAADVADMALTDMSDNANKMGTSMELIQNAYQGFAKQNYTMLDNLKLGYGGTKTEMQRLLADATKLTGVKYDLDNLSDVYEAIHVIQEEMGITGTTALEASTTFTGSMASMKAALSNVLGNLSLGEDIKPALNDLIQTTGTFLFDNLFPMVGNIITGLVGYIVDTAANTDWVEVITEILVKIKDAMTTGIETYFGTDTTMVNDMFDFLIDGIPQIAQFVQDAFGLLWEACNEIWTSIGKPIWDAIVSTIQYVSENWGSISESMSTGFSVLWDYVNTVWTNIGKPIWDAISYVISEVTGLFQENMPEIMMFFSDATAGMQDTWENHLKPIFDAIGDVLNNVLKPAFEFVFQASILPLVTHVFNMITGLWTNMLKPIFDGICDFLLGVFTGDWNKAFSGILNIVTGAIGGVLTVITTTLDTVKNVVENAINFIIDKFDFDWHFPAIKLPHFNISGSFSLNPPSAPSFSIDWYAKAMKNPMIMNSPTAFGINSLGQIMAGGETGSEVVSGTDTLMQLIAQAVASQNNALITILIKILEAIVEMDSNMASNLREALEGMGIDVNNREFARLVKAVT